VRTFSGGRAPHHGRFCRAACVLSPPQIFGHVPVGADFCGIALHSFDLFSGFSCRSRRFELGCAFFPYVWSWAPCSVAFSCWGCMVCSIVQVSHAIVFPHSFFPLIAAARGPCGHLFIFSLFLAFPLWTDHDHGVATDPPRIFFSFSSCFSPLDTFRAASRRATLRRSYLSLFDSRMILLGGTFEPNSPLAGRFWIVPFFFYALPLFRVSRAASEGGRIVFLFSLLPLFHLGIVTFISRVLLLLGRQVVFFFVFRDVASFFRFLSFLFPFFFSDSIHAAVRTTTRRARPSFPPFSPMLPGGNLLGLAATPRDV